MSSPLVPNRYPGFESFTVNDLGLPFNGPSPQSLVMQLPSEGSWFGDVWAFHGNVAQSVWTFGALVWWKTPVGSNVLNGSAFPSPVVASGGPTRSLTVGAPSATGAVTLSLTFDTGNAVTKFTARLYKMRLGTEFSY